MILVGQDLGTVLAGWFWLRVSQEVAVKMLGLKSSEGLTGAGRSSCNVAYSQGWQIGAGLFHRAAGMSSQPGSWPPPEQVIQGGSRQKPCGIQPWKSNTLSFLQCPVGSALSDLWGASQGHEYHLWRWGSWGSSQRLAIVSPVIVKLKPTTHSDNLVQHCSSGYGWLILTFFSSFKYF